MLQLKDCIEFVLKNEGGYSNDAADSGGATNFGITHGDMSRFLGRSVSIQEVKDMTKDTALKIYEAFYWRPMHLQLLISKPIATATLDMGVNMGITRGVKLAQSAVNLLPPEVPLVVDGHLGPKTAAALNSVSASAWLKHFHDLVVARYESIIANNPSQEVFRRGWMNRANRLLTLSHS